MSDSLTFVINPEAEAASVGLLVKSLDEINRLLRDVDYAVNGPKHQHQWMVRSLKSSVPSITVEPDSGVSPSVEVIAEGLRTVTLGTDQPPRYFTERVLEDLTKMKRLFGGKSRAKSIDVFVDGQQAATISRDISAKAGRILSAGYYNIGSLQGTLEAINVHRSPNVTVWERVSGSPVRCSIPNQRGWIDHAKDLLEKSVTVTGNIHYFVNGTPRSITGVIGIEDATPDLHLPRAEFGSIPDERAARDPAEFLHSIRG